MCSDMRGTTRLRNTCVRPGVLSTLCSPPLNPLEQAHQSVHSRPLDAVAKTCVSSCVWDRIGQMTRWSTPRAELHTGFTLMPVSGVREAVSGVSEAVGDEKIGGNEVKGTFNKDMTKDGMIFEAHKQIVKRLNQTCEHIWRASVHSAIRDALLVNVLENLRHWDIDDLCTRRDALLGKTPSRLLDPVLIPSTNCSTNSGTRHC